MLALQIADRKSQTRLDPLGPFALIVALAFSHQAMVSSYRALSSQVPRWQPSVLVLLAASHLFDIWPGPFARDIAMGVGNPPGRGERAMPERGVMGVLVVIVRGQRCIVPLGVGAFSRNERELIESNRIE